MNPTPLRGTFCAWQALALLAVLTLPALAACSGGGEPSVRPLTLEEHAERARFGPYSVLPPAGQGWLLASRNASTVAFGRRPTRTRSLLALASMKEASQAFANQDELAAFVKDDWARADRKDGRYTGRQQQVWSDSRLGPYCVRYRSQQEDHGAGGERTAAGAPSLILRTMGLFCFDPAHPREVIHVGYTERGLRSELGGTFEIDAEHFLNDVRREGAP